VRKHVLVSADDAETRVALLEAEGSVDPTTVPAKGPDPKFKVAELYLERRSTKSIVGNVYKGKVDNVVTGLEAAFVDIGLEKNGFLHVDEIVLPGVETPKRGRGKGKTGDSTIADLLKPGQEITVQVVKDPLKTKGARLSMELAIPGRFLVFSPQGEGVGVSRRLPDRERDRLRRAAKAVEIEQGGVIIRTAAHGAKEEDIGRELPYLYKLAEVLEQRVSETPAPAPVFQEADLAVRVVRDIATDEFEKAFVDNKKEYDRLVSFFMRTAPELAERVELWEGKKGVFEEFGVEKALKSTLSSRVDLPSGGYLIIDYAEALTVIDVNSGSFVGRGKSARLEDTITKTNLEAAEEAVRQMRLRDIGGIIVIDFIDMARARNRDAVLKTLQKALNQDKTKTFVVEISPLGLVEMTRQNVTDGVREIMTRPCRVCNGEGVVPSEETIAIGFARKMREIAIDNPEAEAILLQMNPRVTAEFTGQGAWMLKGLEADTGKKFFFEGSEGLPTDHLDVLMAASRAEVEERAVPFRAGEEVHVELVEPHMFKANDAVAKIDGYIVSVRDGMPFVGKRVMVRIEKAGRNEAEAVIVDGGVEVAQTGVGGGQSVS
jgi:ribonuclease G